MGKSCGGIGKVIDTRRKDQLNSSEGRKESIAVPRMTQANPHGIKEDSAEGMAARSHQ